jgi:uncharacterized oxidoreductase
MAEPLIDFTQRIFESHRVPVAVAEQVARSLVLANLSGHDSHGVIRILEYVEWIDRGLVNPLAKLTVLSERPCILILDGDFGFGQVIGREALGMAIAKTKVDGACILSLRRSGHLGRIGEFMEMAADAGLVAFSFTNTHGGGVLVAPHGGCERRLSANPLGGAAPMPAGPAIVMDISTSTIAEGKLKVARSRGETVPPGSFVNHDGELSQDPEDYYAQPPGALLPMAGHKGFALSILCEVMAGAMTGAGCSRPGIERIANGFMLFLLDPAAFAGSESVADSLGNLSDWIRSSRKQSGFDTIQLPGTPESTARSVRRVQGIDIDRNTWLKICHVASACRVEIPECSEKGSVAP